MPVMITNYQIINYISNNNQLNIYINNELNIIEIGKRKYFNKDYDLAVIQIKENDKINFLEIDDNLFEKKLIIIMTKNQYILLIMIIMILM